MFPLIKLQQVFSSCTKNAKKIDELEAGIKVKGYFSQSSCKVKITEESPDFEWEVLWGQRRVAFSND